MTNGPEDPMTLMAQGATELHEMFTSYIKAGFTRKEALYLVGQYMAAVIAAAQPGHGDQP